MKFGRPVVSLGEPATPFCTAVARESAIRVLPTAIDLGIPSAASRPRFQAADAMRGIAAALVVLYHLEQVRRAPELFARGYLAVDFFFMLSGFVMAHTYDRRWSSNYGGWSFLRARIVRLWPIMALGVAMGGGVAVATGIPLEHVLVLAVLALAFIPLPRAREGVFPLNGVQWSLFFELAANIAHAAILKRLTDRGLAIVTGLFAASLFAVAQTVGNLSVGDAGAPWVGGFLRVGFAYPAGLLLHRLWRRRTLARPTNLALALLALPATLICCANLRWWAIDPLIIVVIVPMIIWSCVTAQMPARFERFAQVAGRLSYPLYAIHRPLIAAAAIIFATSPVAR